MNCFVWLSKYRIIRESLPSGPSFQEHVAGTYAIRIFIRIMKLSWIPYTLEFRHPFRIAHGVRTSTPVMLVKIELNGLCGYGESAMPPYLGESHESVHAFLSKLDLRSYTHTDDLTEILEYVAAVAPGQTAAKAGIDIALHDLKGKTDDESTCLYFGADPSKTPCTSFTIGMGSAGEIRNKIAEAEGYPLLKIKLGGGNDLEILATVHDATSKSFSVDVNQGWTDRDRALELIYRMKEMGVSFVEQPFGKDKFEDHAWLRERSPLPIIADESCQRFSDVERCREAFDGINIKLMKCTGLREAKRMIDLAREYKMKVLIGCMSETSCAVSAAAALTPFADWADLDGPLLIKNDIFKGIWFDKGKINIPAMPGIGVVLEEKVF
jgi:L-alanine-DL-glutamate epimerase-like enolase superfamily enzyme